MYLNFASFIPIVISMIMTPIFSFEVGLMIFIVAPIYFILALITHKYIKKEIIAHRLKLGRITARTGFIFQAIIPIAIFLLAPGSGITYTGLEFTVLICGVTIFIINIIGAILFKRPQEKQSET